jgi:hypothetical protein
LNDTGERPPIPVHRTRSAASSWSSHSSGRVRTGSPPRKTSAGTSSRARPTTWPRRSGPPVAASHGPVARRSRRPGGRAR